MKVLLFCRKILIKTFNLSRVEQSQRFHHLLPRPPSSFVIAVSQSPYVSRACPPLAEVSRSDGGGQRPTKQSHVLLVEQGVATPCSVKIATTPERLSEGVHSSRFTNYASPMPESAMTKQGVSRLFTASSIFNN